MYKASGKIPEVITSALAVVINRRLKRERAGGDKIMVIKNKI